MSGDTPISKAIGKLALQPQRRDQRTQIGVAAALAEPVQRALDLPRAGAHRGQRIGDRLLGIVMGVDADVIAGNMFCHLADDGLDLVRHGAAIGVAQHHPARAGIVGRLGAGQREFRIFLVAVEEMLAVEHHLAARGLRGLHAVADRGEIFLVGGLERDPHLIGRRFCHKADRVGLGFQQRRQTRIVRGRAAGTPGHAERGKARVIELWLLGKEFGVGRIGAGIAALDIVDAELVEHLRDQLLVVQREIDAVGLRAVAQRGVEQIEAFAAHVGPPGVAPSAKRLLHRGVGEPFAVDGDGVALFCDVTALGEKLLRVVAGIDASGSWRRGRRRAFPAHRTASTPTPCPTTLGCT